MNALVTEANDFAQALEKLEQETNAHIGHERFIFLQGYAYAHKEAAQMKDEASDKELLVAQQAALLYLLHCTNSTEGFTGFEQLRVGKNFMQEPTVFAVLSSKDAQHLDAFRDFARSIEVAVWDKYFETVSIWTVSDEHLDERAVTHDFPWAYTANAA